jgi:hypothetical protein
MRIISLPSAPACAGLDHPPRGKYSLNTQRLSYSVGDLSDQPWFRSVNGFSAASAFRRRPERQSFLGGRALGLSPASVSRHISGPEESLVAGWSIVPVASSRSQKPASHFAKVEHLHQLAEANDGSPSSSRCLAEHCASILGC